jgi:hypothetical protein
MSYLDDHYNEIFKKYTTDELLNDIDNYKYGNGRLYKVLNHFFEECMFNCCGKKTKLSPMDVLRDNDKMLSVLEYIKSKPKFFTSDNEVSNVKSSFRNSFSWVRKVANFPCVSARDIYFRYFPNKDKSNINCLDTSCGFGSRMSAVLLSGANYCGFDPNKQLYEKLVEYLKFLRDNEVIDKKQKCGIYCHGSEVYRSELNNLFDVSFTSPPYFNLEKYSNDEGASTNNYDNYNKWLTDFVRPTIENTYMYLKVGGYAMVNIKNISSKETCYDDWLEIFHSIDGFEFVEIFDLKINKKQYGMKYDGVKGNINNCEPVMVFRKIF